MQKKQRKLERKTRSQGELSNNLAKSARLQKDVNELFGPFPDHVFTLGLPKKKNKYQLLKDIQHIQNTAIQTIHKLTVEVASLKESQRSMVQVDNQASIPSGLNLFLMW